jgi:hypothetical protein
MSTANEETAKQLVEAIEELIRAKIALYNDSAFAEHRVDTARQALGEQLTTILNAKADVPTTPEIDDRHSQDWLE